MALQLDTISTISAYRPVRCIATYFFPFPLKKCIAEIIVNGTTIATQTYNMKEIGVGQYQAVIDAQSVIQDFLSPDQSDNATTSSLGTNGQEYKVLNPDLFCFVEFSVTYQEQLVNGKLQDIGVVETIAGYDVFATTAQNFASMDLLEYRPIFGGTSQLLTAAPQEMDICIEDSYYLSAMTSGLGFAANYNLRIQTFDSAGALIDEGILEFLPLLTFTQQDIITGGVGPANIAATTFDQGAVNINNPNVAYYIVEFGALNLASYVPTSVAYRFNIVPCCASYKVRLFWLNDKGGFDAISMQYTQQTIDKTSTTVQRPLNWGPSPTYHSPEYKGQYPINIQANESFDLEYCLKNKSEGIWLQELLYSPEVYAEIDGLPLQSVIVLDGTPITDVKNEISLFEITIQPANSKITMRN